MLSFWRRNKGFVVFSLVLVVLIGLVSQNSGPRARISETENIVLEVMAPFSRALAQGMRFVTGFVADVKELFTIKARNEELEARLASLEMQLDMLIEAERENQRLRELLEYREVNPQLNLVLAKVIGLVQNAWQQELLIDRGSKHGVKLNTPVIVHQGFVGRVYEVSASTSKVVLIIDGRAPIAAQVQETRVRGTLEADPLVPGGLRLIRLARDDNVRAGHLVVTAGTGAFALPKGIPVGRVDKVLVTADGLQLEAMVTPLVDFAALEDVLLVISPEDEDE